MIEHYWDAAPDWANWLAQDWDGAFYWYEEKPYISGVCFLVHGGRTAPVNKEIPNPNWKNTLQSRPKS